jgi:hypothetical protein
LEQEQSTLDGNVMVAGWAILPWKNRVADSVLLTWENELADPLIFARADVKGRRDEIVQRIGDSSYRDCGWVKVLPRDQIPEGARRLNAWAFDAEECHAFLIGSVSLP